jgi:plastocyanin
MTRISLILGAALVAATHAHAADHVVSQKNKEFSTKSITIKAGDSVDFRNDDPFFHNVFSLSDSKSFDLGSYPQGQSRKVTFDKPGTVEVECSIHPNMKMNVEVQRSSSRCRRR